MKLLFAHDTFYATHSSGAVYAYGSFSSVLWTERFLPHFDEILVVGRDKGTVYNSDNLVRSDIDSVSFLLLENINSPLKRIFGASHVKKQIKEAVQRCDAVVVRGPVEFAMLAGKYARRYDVPFAVELSGCAFDHTWYHGSLIGKLYAPFKYLRARYMVKHADFVIYVTEFFLQKRYPSVGITTYVSNVDLDHVPSSVIHARLKKIEYKDQKTKIIFGLIGNFDNALKGLSVAFEAFSFLKHEIDSFELRILGQGNPENWDHVIKDFGLEHNVVFSGVVSSSADVCAWLDDIDIYIQPSFHEGLPRALIEAMSRGCPALASDAGGTDELLSPQFIHRKGDAAQLSKHILNLLSSREILKECANANFEKARSYYRSRLQPKRHEFWKQFKVLVNSVKS